MGLAILEGYQSESLLTGVCFYKVERIWYRMFITQHYSFLQGITPSIKTTDTCYVFIRVRQQELDARLFSL